MYQNHRIYSQGAIYIINFQSEHFDFSLISDIWPSFHEKSKSLDRANIEKLLNQSPPWG